MANSETFVKTKNMIAAEKLYNIEYSDVTMMIDDLIDKYDEGEISKDEAITIAANHSSEAKEMLIKFF